jgi:choline dehydrogenase-like flavoprotein
MPAEPRQNHDDVIIIGSRPAGASLAQRPAPTGKKILPIERGDDLPRTQTNWDVNAVPSVTRSRRLNQRRFG